MTDAVHDLAASVWDERRERRLVRDARFQARRLALSVANNVLASEGYDPEADVRVRWMRRLIEEMRAMPGWAMPKAGADLEVAVLWALGRQEVALSGKAAAAGEGMDGDEESKTI